MLDPLGKPRSTLGYAGEQSKFNKKKIFYLVYFHLFVFDCI